MRTETAPFERSDNDSEISSGAERPAKLWTLHIKYSGYQLIALVSAAFIIAIYLLLQLNKLPNTSLSYSILNAIISLLFNFSSSALVKVFGFLISLFGLSKSFPLGERLP